MYNGRTILQAIARGQQVVVSNLTNIGNIIIKCISGIANPITPPIMHGMPSAAAESGRISFCRLAYTC